MNILYLSFSYAVDSKDLFQGSYKMSGANCTLCICSAIPERVQMVQRMIGKDLFSKVVLSSYDPSKEFKVVKNSGDQVVLVIFGPLGSDAIKYLCDDHHLPKEQRRVRWIHSLSAGVDWYNLSDLRDELVNIPFTNGRGSFNSALAEHVLYSMLYFNRQTWRLQACRAERKWDPFNMIEVRGKTMGIIGYGDIGHATSRLAVALGMEVTGVRRSPPAAPVDEHGVRLVHEEGERDRVIRESDFVVNILPATEATKQFFNRERFATMKPSAVYINIGRGITQNDQDLACALRDGVIRGAAVDVFEKEPLPTESPLWELSDDKILLTSHNACVTDDAQWLMVNIFVANAKCFLQGNPLGGYQPNLNAGY